jgi:hypothetical protein
LPLTITVTKIALCGHKLTCNTHPQCHVTQQNSKHLIGVIVFGTMVHMRVEIDA